MVTHLKNMFFCYYDSSATFCCCYRVVRLPHFNAMLVIQRSKYRILTEVNSEFSHVPENSCRIMGINMVVPELALLHHHLNVKLALVLRYYLRMRILGRTLEPHPLFTWNRLTSEIFDKSNP